MGDRTSLWWPVAAAAVVGTELTLLLTHSALAGALPVLVLGLVLLTNARDKALAFACMGLVTVSWDKVSLRTGGMTLKPAYVLFVLALVIDLMEHPNAPEGEDGAAWRRRRTVQAAVAASILLLFAATVVGGYTVEGLRQLFVVLLGALVPAWTCYRIGRSPERRNTLLAWALLGAAAVAAFGIYQFVGVYLGLPDPAPYTGGRAGIARTAGLSYEPAFFSMYLLSLTPLAVALLLERKTERTVQVPIRVVFCLLLMGTLAANARAGYLVLPFAVILPLVMRSSPRPVRARPLALGCLTIATIATGSLVAGFDVLDFASSRLASIANTEEVSSNRPRLELYAIEWDIAADHPVLGVGPGALSYALEEKGRSPVQEDKGQLVPQERSRVVANNIWLQAALDCGVLGPLAVAVILSVAFRLARRGRGAHARQLAVGYLLVMLVGGSLTSIFWDAKYWTVLALALAAEQVPQRQRGTHDEVWRHAREGAGNPL